MSVRVVVSRCVCVSSLSPCRRQRSLTWRPPRRIQSRVVTIVVSVALCVAVSVPAVRRRTLALGRCVSVSLTAVRALQSTISQSRPGTCPRPRPAAGIVRGIQFLLKSAFEFQVTVEVLLDSTSTRVNCRFITELGTGARDVHLDLH